MKFLERSVIIYSIILSGTYCAKRRQYDYSSSSESYVGPSSYTTSFGGDYPGYGNYGSLLNTGNPEYTSSYSSYGPESEPGKGFSSTSYVNYPSSTSVIQDSPSQQPSLPANWQNSYFNYLSSLKIPTSPNPTQSEPTQISEHIEITKPIVVPVYKKFPYAVSKKFPVAIPHPVLVPVPAPYPVNVEISHPVAVPVIHEVRIPVEKEVLYPIETRVPVTVEKPVQYIVEKHYPVYVPKPYPVKIPIVKTIIHKSPKKW